MMKFAQNVAVLVALFCTVIVANWRSADGPPIGRESVSYAVPQPDPTDPSFLLAGDAAFRVTHIKFDHKGDDNQLGDGLNIKYGRTGNLQHADKSGDGEWINPALPGARSEPALYVARDFVTVRVRIESKNTPIDSATIWAIETVASGATANWFNVAASSVQFSYATPWLLETDPDARWVTSGNDGTEYVELNVGGIKKTIDKAACDWQWMVSDISFVGGGVDPASYEITKSGSTALVDGTLLYPSHTFYTVLRVPKAPWYAPSMPGGSDSVEPRVDALEVSIVKAKSIGIGNLGAAASRVTQYAFNEHPVTYEKNLGAALTITNGCLSTTQVSSDIDAWFTLASVASVNCFDQACAVAAMIALLGGAPQYILMEPFGYISPTSLCGWNQPGGINYGVSNCNNPFHGNASAYQQTPRVGDDDTEFHNLIGTSTPKRSAFRRHGFVEFTSKVFDATCGPHVGTEIRSAYLSSAVDLSHTGAGVPQTDDEKVAPDGLPPTITVRADGRQNGDETNAIVIQMYIKDSNQ